MSKLIVKAPVYHNHASYCARNVTAFTSCTCGADQAKFPQTNRDCLREIVTGLEAALETKDRRIDEMEDELRRWRDTADGKD